MHIHTQLNTNTAAVAEFTYERRSWLTPPLGMADRRGGGRGEGVMEEMLDKD